MVGVDLKRGEQKSLVARFLTATLGLDSHEYRIDLSQRFRVVTLQNPTFSGRVVLIENTQVDRLLAVGTTSAPSLKCACPLKFGLVIKVVGVENQGFPASVENPSVR